MELIAGIAGAVATSFGGLVGFLHKKLSARLDALDQKDITTTNELLLKLDRPQVKEVIEDKLAPIHVTLKDIRIDLHEIRKDLKELTKRD